MKRVTKILLAVAIAISLIAAVNLVANAENYTEGIFTYSVSNEKATIVGCDETASGVVEIPSTLGGYPVKSIGDKAFDGCRLITHIEIPDGVTDIGTYAFEFCKGLESIRLPQTLLYLGDYAFKYCTALVSVEIPEGINEIKQYTFSECTLLESVTIPLSVSRLNKGIFYDCTSLKSIYYNGTKAQWNKVLKNSVYFYMPSNVKLYTISNTLIDSVDYKLRCTLEAKDDMVVLTAQTPNTSSVKVRFGDYDVEIEKNSDFITVDKGVITVKNPGVGKVEVPIIIKNGNSSTELMLVADFGNVLNYMLRAKVKQNGNDIVLESGSSNMYIGFDGAVTVKSASRNMLGRYAADGEYIRFYNPVYDDGNLVIEVTKADGTAVTYNVTTKFATKTYTPVAATLRCTYEISGDDITVTANAGASNVYLQIGKYYGETLSTENAQEQYVKQIEAKGWRIYRSSKAVDFYIAFDATDYSADKISRHIVVNF